MRGKAISDGLRCGRMDPVTVETFEAVDVDGALVLVAFHGVGAAAPIAASYLRQHLDLPLVGQVRAQQLGPVVHVSNGIATGPIRVYGGEVACHLDKDCPRLYVIMAELPIDVEIAGELADAILAWAGGARMVISLDAVVRGADDHTPDVYSLAYTASGLKKLSATKAPSLDGAVIVGPTAAILTRSRDHHVDAGALVVEAAKAHPDGRAAAALIEALDKLVPEVVFDNEPLLEEALAIEKQIENAIGQAEAAQPKRPMHTFI